MSVLHGIDSIVVNVGILSGSDCSGISPREVCCILRVSGRGCRCHLGELANGIAGCVALGAIDVEGGGAVADPSPAERMTGGEAAAVVFADAPVGTAPK